jgi:hypothetical protein
MCKILQTIIAAAIVAGCAAPLSASATDSKAIELAYNVFTGGLPIGKATVTVRFDDNAYSVVSKASTIGAVRWFYKAAIASDTAGKIDGNTVIPTQFTLDTLAGKKAQDVSVRYKDGVPNAVWADPPFQKRSYQIDPRAQIDTLDPLSAVVLAILKGAESDICSVRLPIYDGRRRYDVLFEGQIAEEMVNGVKYIDCAARWRRIGGFKAKHMAKPDYTFTVRMRIDPDGITIPVRAWASTAFGGAIVVLRK